VLKSHTTLFSSAVSGEWHIPLVIQFFSFGLFNGTSSTTEIGSNGHEPRQRIRDLEGVMKITLTPPPKAGIQDVMLQTYGREYTRFSPIWMSASCYPSTRDVDDPPSYARFANLTGSSYLQGRGNYLIDAASFYKQWVNTQMPEKPFIEKFFSVSWFITDYFTSV